MKKRNMKFPEGGDTGVPADTGGGASFPKPPPQVDPDEVDD